MKITLKILVVAGLLSCKSNSEKNEEEYTPLENTVAQIQDQKSESYQRGKEIYMDFCIACHLPNGKGIPGTFPPLDGSNWLTEKRIESIHAVKFGLKGPISVNGKEYDNIMVSQGLTDQEVADVMNYINNSWSNAVKKPVTVEEVAAVKK